MFPYILLDGMLGIENPNMIVCNKVYLFRTGYIRYAKRFCTNLHESAKKESHVIEQELGFATMKIEEKQKSEFSRSGRRFFRFF